MRPAYLIATVGLGLALMSPPSVCAQEVPKPATSAGSGPSGTLADPLPAEITWPPHQSPFEQELEAAQTALGPLKAMLTSPDPFVRKRALEGLAVDPSQEGVTVCLAHLADPHAEVQVAARDALLRMNADWVAADLKRLMGGGGPMLIAAVDAALPSMKAKLEAPFLNTLGDDAEPRIDRLVAAYCLGRIGSRLAVPLLADGAWSRDQLLSEYCAYALSSIVDPASVAEMIALIDHPNPEVRWAAVQGLGTVGGPNAMDALRGIAAGESERIVSLRREAIYALAKAGDLQSIPVIMQVMQQGPSLSTPAIEAMQYLTGLTFGNSVRSWRQWYESVRQEFAPPPLMPAGHGPIGFPADYSFLAVPTPEELPQSGDGAPGERAPIRPSRPDPGMVPAPAATPPPSAPAARQPRVENQEFDMPDSMRRALDRLSRGEL